MSNAKHEMITQEVRALAVQTDDSEMVKACIQLMKKYINGSFSSYIIKYRFDKPKMYTDRCDTLEQLLKQVREARLSKSDANLVTFLVGKANTYKYPSKVAEGEQIIIGSFVKWSSLYDDIVKVISETLPRPSEDAVHAVARVGYLLEQEARLTGQVATLTQDRDRLRVENASLRSQIGALNTKIDDLEANDIAKTQKIQQLTQRISESEQTVHDLTASLDRREQDVESHEKQLAIQTKQIQMLLAHAGLSSQFEGITSSRKEANSSSSELDTDPSLANVNQALYTPG